jgi:hypothetical protein
MRGASAAPAGRFTPTELDGLPAPVARYFRLVLRDGQPLVRHARLRQSGQFLVRPAQQVWGPFEAVQHIVTAPPGFVWDARIRMAPGVTVKVRDSFVDGTGSMLGKALGLFTVVRLERTPPIAAAALHRYLAEAAWCPTMLLPAAGVSWTPIDASTARATLTAGATTVWLECRFGADGLIERVFTPERHYAAAGRTMPMPWQGRFSEYAERHGMRIPTVGEVEWLLPDGPQPYWRGRITEIEYE